MKSLLVLVLWRQKAQAAHKPMEHGMKIGAKNITLGLTVILSLSGCVALVEQPPEVAVVESDRRGPPPWAPAHGWRRKQETYYYYPATQVYYYPSLRRYYWIDGREWRSGDRLPRRFIADDNKRIVLDLDYEPHTQHARIVKNYPRDYFERANRKGRAW